MRTHLFRSSPTKTTPPLSPPHSTFSESLIEESIETAQSIIERWASSASELVSSSIFSSSSNRHEAAQYIEAVHHLQSSMRYLVSVDPASKKLVLAQNLMQTAMKLLEKEFYRILKSNREYLDPESVSVRSWEGSRLSASTRTSVSGSDDGDAEEDNDISELTSGKGPDRNTDAMDDLKMIVDCMISAGYAKECVKIYKIIRRSIVDETLYNLGVERLSLAQVQKMEPEILEAKIRKWLHAVKYAVRTLFYGERILCDHVFSASTSIGESCFTEIAKEGALTLFSFPESVGNCKKILTPEKIFRPLDMYEAIAELFPEIEAIFCFDSTAIVRSQAVESTAKLGEAVRFMMAEFESAIHQDASKSPLPGGGVHPLTRYVMNYLTFLSDYTHALEDILVGWKLTSPSPLPESSFGDEFENDGVWSSPVTVRLAWVILLVLCKIDGKAQLYDDLAQSYLFLANNLRYVVVKVRASNLKLLLGADWSERHEAKVRQYAASYEKLGWTKVMTSLPNDLTADISLDQARDCFRRFNTEFEAAYKKQRSWVVPDQKLRDEIKVSAARKLVTAYNEFYGKYRVALTRESLGESIVRFAPEDLENYLSDLFFGTSGSGSVASITQGSSSSSTSSHSQGGRRG